VRRARRGWARRYIRAALRFVSWADRKDVAAALRPLYTAENEQAALAEREKLEHKHGDKYLTVIRTFRGRWEQFVPFLSYPQEIRRMLYTTNAVESLNSQLRKVLRSRGPFPMRTLSSMSSFSRSRTPRPTGEPQRTGTASSLSSISSSKDVCLRESNYREDLTRSASASPRLAIRPFSSFRQRSIISW
jgi:hypothetical protein